MFLIFHWPLYKKLNVNCFCFLIKTKKNIMIEICNGRVFVEGVETVDPTLIGYALLDFAESQENDEALNDEIRELQRKIREFKT